MKKLGVLVIALLVIVMVGVGTAAYAFYSVARADFTLIIHSAEGAAIGLDLEAKQNTLRPADTSANVADYSAAQGTNNEQIAVYTIGYEASSDVDVKLFISDVVFEYADETEQNSDALHAQRDNYLRSILRFCLTVGAASDVWTTNYMASNKDNLAPISFASGSSGSISCKVRFAQIDNENVVPVSQELIPPFYDGVKISFMVNAEVQED